MSARLALVVALLSAAPAAGHGQHQAGIAVARIHAGAQIRLGLTNGERLEGQLRSVTGDSLLVAAPGGERWIALDRIEELHERGRATKMAAIVGAVVGGVAGGAVVTVGCAIGRSDDGVIGNENQWVDCAAVGGALGAAGGAAIGAGIGALIPRWHVRFRAGNALN